MSTKEGVGSARWACNEIGQRVTEESTYDDDEAEPDEGRVAAVYE